MRAETALITRFSAVDDIFHDADRFAERVPFAESLQDFYYDHFCHGGGQTVPDLSEYRLKPTHTANDKKTGPRHDSGISIYQIPDSLLTAAEAKVYEETGAGYEATLAAIIDGVWLDSNLGLVLYVNDLPCAVAGVATYTRDVTIMQLQGYDVAARYMLKDEKEPHRFELPQVVQIDNSSLLKGFRWEKLLVMAVEEILRLAGVNECVIQSAKNNYWANNQDGDYVLPYPQARMRYDVTAKRMGYKLGDDDDFHKTLD